MEKAYRYRFYPTVEQDLLCGEQLVVCGWFLTEPWLGEPKLV
jgi:hypothetical protein